MQGAGDGDLTTRSLLLRGYGPLAALLVAVVLVATLAPSVREDTTGDAAVATGPRPGVAAAPGAGGGGPTAPGEGAGDDAAATGATGTASGVVASGAGAGGGHVGECDDRDAQIPGDPYSPPCIAFEGDNGGATHRGVNGEEILVSFRVTDEAGAQEALAQVAGAEITDTPDDVRHTLEGLIEYFNTRFQFYGRRIVPVYHDGRGSLTNELLGGGQAEAEADAINVAEEIGAFAEAAAYSMPFSDGLAARGVIALGAPYVPRSWMENRRPYVWSLATDCSIIVETVIEHYIKRIYGKPAEWARGNLEGRPRNAASLSPDNPEYQACVDDGEAEARRLIGNDVAQRLTYRFDLGSMSNQATNVIARLKSMEITTVLCGCDPIFPVFLTAKATEQNYWPEWYVSGTALTDIDLVGQLYDQEQWARAFGISFLGQNQPLRASYGYQAYQAVRPGQEPAFAVDVFYYQLYLLSIGLQMAGPNLTPETFEQGMFAYPGGGPGPVGTWGFGPGNRTPTEDAREIWWDPEAISPQNNEPGAYIETEPGVRYRKGQWPEGDPPVFQR